MWGWVKVASWHRIRSTIRLPNTYETFCGLTATGEPRDTFVSYEKTCETCMRLSNTKVDDPTAPEKLVVHPEPVEVGPPPEDLVVQPEPVEVDDDEEEEDA
jgi:hypothetical protein